MPYVPGQPKKGNKLRRQSKGIKEFSRVLIACEGEKTEPNYLRELCRELGLTGTCVEVVGKECGSSPISVCDYAIGRFKQDGGFDKVFCVFDRDTHLTFHAAIDKIAAHSSKKMKSVVSYPCFEYWILLHFRYTRASTPAAGKKSSGDRMLELVVAEWPEYAKGGKNVYDYLSKRGLTDTAITNATRARADTHATEDPDPSTDVDELVVYLRQLGKEFEAISTP
jgi:hypothetical protein